MVFEDDGEETPLKKGCEERRSLLCRDLQRSVEKEGRFRRPTALSKNTDPAGHVQGQLQETEPMALQCLFKRKFLYLNFLSAQAGLLTELSSSFSLESC